MRDLSLYEGRPADCSGREAREVRCYDLLDSLGVAFVRTDHEPATTMAVCGDIDAVLGSMICKNLFLCNRQKTDFYLLVMPGDKPFKTRDLSAQLGIARLSFAPEEKMEELLDLQPGSVSILGLMNDKDSRVRLLIDRDVLGQETFACHPCKNTSSIRFALSDLTEKLIPAMGHTPTVVTL